jgi:hypothetical protein
LAVSDIQVRRACRHCGLAAAVLIALFILRMPAPIAARVAFFGAVRDYPSAGSSST